MKDNILGRLWARTLESDDPIFEEAAVEIERLMVEVRKLEGFYRSVNEALNMGDGSYRP